MSKFKLIENHSSPDYKTKRFTVAHVDHKIGVGEIFWNGLDKCYKFYAWNKNHYSAEDLKELITLIEGID